MEELLFDFSKTDGIVKPMHCMNNGPVGDGVRKTGNSVAYSELEIPYARLHDSSFCTSYGGEWTVDVHRIFCDFNADVNDQNSYDFSETDKYLLNIQSVGTKVFYRLGASIEHYKKKGTYPPKDFQKWAEICEHIINHYNNGWSNGYQMGIEYWEIWNEPDCKNADGSNPCWQGTDEEFFEFYKTVSKYLKSKFPTLKIGGPAVCFWGSGFAQKFLPYARKNDIPLDFFSFHCYGYTVEFVEETIKNFKNLLIENGYKNTETILNEWNYIKGWLGEIYTNSIKTIMGLKGSAFTLGVMCMGQESPLDMLMYYDARPTSYNGLFGLSGKEKLKTFYTVKAYSHLYSLKNYVKPDSKVDNIYSCGASNTDEKAILVTYFDDDEKEKTKDIKVNVKNACNGKAMKVEYYKISENEDLELKREEIFTSDDFALYLKMNLFETCLIKIKQL